VLPLARHFLKLQADLYSEPCRAPDADAAAILSRYAWPGNVRELANAIEHAHVLARGEAITPADLPERVRIGGAAVRADAQSLPTELCLEDLERRAIAEALRRTRHNKAAAARMLGINIQRLGRKIEKLGVVAK
jgi:DNA-binding NtrC family response regulator